MVATDQHSTTAWIADHDPLAVVLGFDPAIDPIGHDVRSSYVETYWLPILGPSAIWAARRLVDWLDTAPGGVEVPLAPFGRSLGLGAGAAKNSPIVRTLARLAEFGMAAIDDESYAIRRCFPPLNSRQLNRLPSYLAQRHHAELEVAR